MVFADAVVPIDEDKIIMQKLVWLYNEPKPIQRIIYNWSRPHTGLGKGTTLAMAMRFIQRPITLYEILTPRGFQYITT